MLELLKSMWRQALIGCIAVGGSIAVFLHKPIPQDPSYHHFADCRSLGSIPNGWNVVSNVPFLLVGLAGLCLWLHASLIRKLRPDAASFVFFAGILLTAFGSAYYHWQPNTNSLVWDRVPMTIAFMALFSSVTGDCLQGRAGKYLLLPLILLGIFAVLYWRHGERDGQGDLRLYILVQFLPMLLIPSMLLLFGSRSYPTRYLWLMILVYALAKLFEYYDASFFRVTGISGHTIKHLAASAAPFFYLRGWLFAQRGHLTVSHRVDSEDLPGADAENT